MLSQGLDGGLKARPEDGGSGCKEQVSRQSPHDATFGIMLSSGPLNSGLHNNLAVYLFKAVVLSGRKKSCAPSLEGSKGGLEANARHQVLMVPKSLWNVQHQVAKKQCLSGEHEVNR